MAYGFFVNNWAKRTSIRKLEKKKRNNSIKTEWINSDITFKLTTKVPGTTGEKRTDRKYPGLARFDFEFTAEKRRRNPAAEYS